MASEVTYMRMGDLIILQDKVNSDNNEFPVLGLNKEKSFMPTVANVNDVNLQKYKVVEKGWFAFSGMQTGRDVCIRLARYTDDFPALISPAYTTFTLRDRVGEKEISPAYVFMFFNREESDRYGAFISDSSVRANLDWSRFCDIEIPVPDIEIQRQLVDVWEGLNGLKVDNDAQAEPLMGLCMSYLKKLREEYVTVPLSQKIESCEGRNKEGLLTIENVRGISIAKSFIFSKANMEGVPLGNYKIVRPNEFAFVTVTSRNGEKISLAYNDSQENYLVSATYEVFRVVTDDLLPEYLYLWFLRPEFDRYARFHSWGSARETFNMDDMKRVCIPIPDKSIQQAIVDIYKCAKESKSISSEAEKLRKAVAPALIQKAIHY